MENYNAEKAARVWQRVHSTPVVPAPGEEAAQLTALINAEWTDAATYLHLSRRLQGRQATLLHTLYEQEHAHAACLKGIYTLLTGKRAVTHSTTPAQEPLDATLRRCYGREMRCLAEYERWAAHREYGPVFARLAQQEQEHCRILLEILGSL